MAYHIKNFPSRNVLPILLAASWLAICYLAATPSGVSANDVVYTETFDNDSANWANYDRSGFLTYVPTGSDDGFVSSDVSFADIGQGVLFRGEQQFNSSDNAFVGNWQDLGYTQLSFSVRHNAPEPVRFSARIAKPANFPGATAVSLGDPVPAGVWTDLTFDISQGSPQLFFFEGGDYASIFEEIGNLQITVSAPAGLENDATLYTFVLDNVSLAVPEPSSLAVASLLGIGLIAVRRRR